MANTVAVTSKLSSTIDVVVMSNSSYTVTHTVDATITVPKAHHTIQTVGTTREAVSVGDCRTTSAGYDYVVEVWNRDADHFVTVELQYGASDYWSMAVIHPGGCFGPVVMKKKDASGYGGLFLDADTADCDCEIVVAEIGTPT